MLRPQTWPDTACTLHHVFLETMRAKQLPGEMRLSYVLRFVGKPLNVHMRSDIVFCNAL